MYCRSLFTAEKINVHCCHQTMTTDQTILQLRTCSQRMSNLPSLTKKDFTLKILQKRIENNKKFDTFDTFRVEEIVVSVINSELFSHSTDYLQTQEKNLIMISIR